MTTQAVAGKPVFVREAQIDRNGALDFTRLVAIACVVLLHTVSGVSDTMPEQMTAAQLDVYRCIEALCACGVPLFLMISGALLLDPEKEIPVSVLLKKYVRRIVLAILLFGTLFAFLELMAFPEGLHSSAPGEAFLQMLSGDSWAHLWYLYAALGIYLVLPVLRGFSRTADGDTYRYILIVLFVFLSLLPFFAEITGFRTGFYLPFSGIYVFYFLAGYYVSAYLRIPGACGLPGLTAAACAVLIAVSRVSHLPFALDYDTPLIVVYSVCLFMVFLRLRGTFPRAGVLAKYVFGMYLTHTVFLNLLYKICHITPLAAGGYVLIPVFWAGAFLFSLAASAVLALIPPLRKYVL